MKYTKNWKYRVEEGFAYKLNCSYSNKTTFKTDWFTLTPDGWLVIYKYYMWDGATKFPDFKWIMTPSAIHDALHQCINEGAITEGENDLIDLELDLAIEGNQASKFCKKCLMRFRGWYVKTATNWVDQKQGEMVKVLEIPPLKNEIPLSKFNELRGM